MLLAGDELGRTQRGNNNAYCQDSEIGWLDWNIEKRGRSLIQFVQQLIRLRHNYPILRRSRFLTGDYNEELGVKDVTWINASGAEMRVEEWDDGDMHCFGMLMDGRAQPTGISRRGEDATLLMVLNAHNDLVKFTLPETMGGREWSLLIDTNLAEISETSNFVSGDSYSAPGSSRLRFAWLAVEPGLLCRGNPQGLPAHPDRSDRGLAYRAGVEPRRCAEFRRRTPQASRWDGGSTDADRICSRTRPRRRHLRDYSGRTHCRRGPSACRGR
jgi:hypothetical protein